MARALRIAVGYEHPLSASAARHRALAIHAPLRAGAAGYAFEDDSPQVLVAAIRAVARGHPWPPDRRTDDDLGSLTLQERVVTGQLDRVPCLPGRHAGAEPEQRLPKLRPQYVRWRSGV